MRSDSCKMSARDSLGVSLTLLAKLSSVTSLVFYGLDRYFEILSKFICSSFKFFQILSNSFGCLVSFKIFRERFVTFGFLLKRHFCWFCIFCCIFFFGNQ